jgi:hypothetical protein
MKSKILLPVLGLALIGGAILYNPNVFSKVKTTKMSASLLDDNPTVSDKKVINPFPKEMEIKTESFFNTDAQTKFTIRELLNKNEIQNLFSKNELPQSFNCKELSYEIDIHNQNANAPRYDMKYKKEIEIEVLTNAVNLYENPFVFSQLYHVNNITLSPAKGKYLYDEHFPENQPEERAYLVRKVSCLLPLFNEDNQIQYLHFNAYTRHVERGVYETYENYVVKYNNDGTINHVINFSKGRLNWVKLNYDASSKVTSADNVSLYQHKESEGKYKVGLSYYKIMINNKG